MGLDIHGANSDKGYSRSYSTIHIIRCMALRTEGFEDDMAAFHELQKKGETWTKYPKFRQLLHFSDAEGLMIRDRWLEGIDISESFELGCIDDLYKELSIIKDQVARRPDIFKDLPLEPFWELYDLVEDELFEDKEYDERRGNATLLFG